MYTMYVGGEPADKDWYGQVSIHHFNTLILAMTVRRGFTRKWTDKNGVIADISCICLVSVPVTPSCFCL